MTAVMRADTHSGRLPAPATGVDQEGPPGVAQRVVDIHPMTRRNLIDALRQEALLAVRLLAYAHRAEADGEDPAARTLRQLASIDVGHAREILDLLGWVTDLRDNVLAQVVEDSTVHGLHYPRFASDARSAGDEAAAALFVRLTSDETEAAVVLLGLLGRHQGGANR